MSLFTLFLIGASRLYSSDAPAGSKRPVTVADVVRMVHVADIGHSSSWQEGMAIRSPNGRHFVVVLRRGDINDNTNIYSLMSIEADGIFTKPKMKVLTSFRSSSNEDAIQQVTWLNDNSTILFLGKQNSELTQIFAIDCLTGVLKRLTQHVTNVTSYSASPDGRQIAYLAEKPPKELLTKGVLRNGYNVSADIAIQQLIAGRVVHGSTECCELLLWKKGEKEDAQLTLRGKILTPQMWMSLSPDGRWLLAKTLVPHVDPIWQGYDDPILAEVMKRKLPSGSMIYIEQYELMDLSSRQSRPLIDAPIGYSGTEAMWAADSQSVIATDVHLPLDTSDEHERQLRRAKTFVAEVVLATGRVSSITYESMRLVGFDQASGLWKFTNRSAEKTDRGSIKPVYYRKEGTGWQKEEALPSTATPLSQQIDMLVDEGLNRPPRLMAVNEVTGQRHEVLDLNPQFENLSFGQEKDIRWTDSTGHEFMGGLYLPPDYTPGHRYPLVIQTHGYRSGEFWIDGPYTTAFSAQPLANKDIVVLQLPQLSGDTYSVEGEQNMHAMETAIQYLIDQQIIDPNRIGLIGFSRTCFYVKYFLTHSKMHIAAAETTDGVDAGYLQYLTSAGPYPNVAADAEALNGGVPFGEGLSQWLKNSPGFLLDHVTTPVEIQAIGIDSVLFQLEWFSGLTRLGRAVDFTYIPTGTHVLHKPWDRIVSQQNTVDWFCFWLQGYEDPDPTKTSQYTRWRHLRELRDTTDGTKTQPHPDTIKPN